MRLSFDRIVVGPVRFRILFGSSDSVSVSVFSSSILPRFSFFLSTYPGLVVSLRHTFFRCPILPHLAHSCSLPCTQVYGWGPRITTLVTLLAVLGVFPDRFRLLILS